MTTARPRPIGAVVLAAGGSARLGRPKALVVFRGDTLLGRTIAAARGAGCEPVVVVTRAGEEEFASEGRARGAITVVNPQAHEGLSSSIRTGIVELLRRAPRVSGVLMLVVDQPWISEGTLRRLCERFDGAPNRIVASSYEGTQGVPALFARAHFSALAALDGDRGARSLIVRHAADVVAIEWPDGGRDLDDPRTLEALESDPTNQGAGSDQ